VKSIPAHSQGESVMQANTEGADYALGVGSDYRSVIKWRDN